jgi:hypothetical protein
MSRSPCAVRYISMLVPVIMKEIPIAVAYMEIGQALPD